MVHRMAEAQIAAPRLAQSNQDWRITIGIIAAGLIALLALFHVTAESAVYQWNNSSAYNYGYLIAPISGYLLWIERKAIAVWQPSPSLAGLALGGGFALVWLLADLLGIDEGRHVGLVGMMQGLFLTALGWPLYKRIAFPLNYLWLLVPTGEFLLGPLQTLSHAVAVVMLRLSGIPTYAEGILIQVPSGNFLVEPGCSGLNFLLASIALALLYGKLTYRRWSARVICMATAVVASILSNFVRVYLIVAITEWSDRQINIADDHLFYGWVFFGIIMMLMMWWGMRFRDVFEDSPDPANEKPVTPVPSSPGRRAAYVSAALLIFAAPTILSQATANTPATNVSITLPDTIGAWKRTGQQTSWKPEFAAADAVTVARYSDGSRAAEIAIAYYASQFDGHEAAAGQNSPASAPDWEVGRRGSREIVVQGKSVAAATAELRSPREPRVALSWYESSSCVTASRLIAKACAARERVFGQTSSGAYVALSAPTGENADTAFAAMEDFARALAPVKESVSARGVANP